MAGGFWTDERVERLKVLVAEGHSAEAIRVIVGHKSRSAIIGKVHRIGLSLANSPKRKRTKAKPVRRAPIQVKPKSPLRRALEMAPEPIPGPRPEDIARISFAELQDHLCHWIPGDPSEGDPLHSKKYCGLPIVHGALSPLCLDHLRRAFRPIEQQPREIRRSFANDNARAPVRETEKV